METNVGSEGGQIEWEPPGREQEQRAARGRMVPSAGRSVKQCLDAPHQSKEH